MEKENNYETYAFTFGVIAFFCSIFLFIIGQILASFALYYGIICQYKLYRSMNITVFILSLITFVITLIGIV